jgi:hypothetical protein
MNANDFKYLPSYTMFHNYMKRVNGHVHSSLYSQPATSTAPSTSVDNSRLANQQML